MPLSRTLDGAVVVITGGSSGIGAATARELSRRGATTVLAARGSEQLNAVAAECRGRALAVPTDVSDPAAVDRLAARTMAEFGRLDAWVNNAAVSLYGPLVDAPLDQLRQVIETDLLGYVYGARAAIPLLRRSGGGVLVNNASILAKVTMPYQGPYVIAKHGVRALSTVLRQELRAAGVRSVSVCTVLPAAIDTPFFGHAANHSGRGLRPPPPVYRPSTVAGTIVRLLERPRREAYAGGAARALAAQWTVLPALAEWALTWYGKRFQFTGSPAPDTSGNLYLTSEDVRRPDQRVATGG